MPLYPRRLSKPGLWTGVNWSSPVANRVGLLVPFNENGGTIHDAVTNASAIANNAPGWGGSLVGPVATYASNANHQFLTPNFGPIFTCVLIASTSSVATNDQNIIEHSSGANDGWRFRWGASVQWIFTLGSVADYTVSAGLFTQTDNDVILYVLSCTGAGGAITITGRNLTNPSSPITTSSTAIGTMVGTPSQVTLGSISWYTGFPLVGSIAFTAIWPYVRNDLTQLLDLPYLWSIFQPQAGWLFNPVVGPTTATLTGPTSGVLGSPSGAFTVTLDQPAGPGGVIVTATSTVGTDVFSSN